MVQFARLGAEHGADALRSDLHDAVVLLRRIGHLETFRRGMRHRLLTVDVLAGVTGIHNYSLVPMVGNRRDECSRYLCARAVRDNGEWLEGPGCP